MFRPFGGSWKGPLRLEIRFLNALNQPAACDLLSAFLRFLPVLCRKRARNTGQDRARSGKIGGRRALDTPERNTMETHAECALPVVSACRESDVRPRSPVDSPLNTGSTLPAAARTRSHTGSARGYLRPSHASSSAINTSLNAKAFPLGRQGDSLTCDDGFSGEAAVQRRTSVAATARGLPPAQRRCRVRSSKACFSLLPWPTGAPDPTERAMVTPCASTVSDRRLGKPGQAVAVAVAVAAALEAVVTKVMSLLLFTAIETSAECHPRFSRRGPA